MACGGGGGAKSVFAPHTHTRVPFSHLCRAFIHGSIPGTIIAIGQVKSTVDWRHTTKLHFSPKHLKHFQVEFRIASHTGLSRCFSSTFYRAETRELKWCDMSGSWKHKYRAWKNLCRGLEPTEEVLGLTRLWERAELLQPVLVDSNSRSCSQDINAPLLFPGFLLSISQTSHHGFVFYSCPQNTWRVS